LLPKLPGGRKREHRHLQINEGNLDHQHDNQSSRLVFSLSQRIVRGELAAGEKLAEIPLAEQFGVSRTPVRQALAVLEKEGLLVRDSSRSYVVRRFSLQEILDAIEVRAVLEGLAAAQVAQRRLPWSLLREFEMILGEAEEIIGEIERSGPTIELTSRYYNANERFHTALLDRANNRTISTALEVSAKVPFASVGSMARYSDSAEEAPANDRERTRLLLLSHLQHQDIFEALKAGDASRAETLMREHGHIGIRNLHLSENYANHSGANHSGASGPVGTLVS
jgi:GntR family transcriptional regulator, vanillate catabolism transcriptional regulator